MPEYFAITLVTIGFALFVALAAIVIAKQLNRFQQQVDDNIASLSGKVSELSERITELQQGVVVHGRDLEAIRAEFAMHITSDGSSEIDYQQAIKAASGGVSATEVSERYGLREAEAQLLVAVYGK